MDSLDSFLRLPHWLRQTVVAGAGMRNRLLRHGRTYRRTFDQLAESETWTPGLMAGLQSKLLLELLSEARLGTDYYRDALTSFSGPDLSALTKELDVRALPLLDKSTLKGNTSSFDNKLRRSAARSSTSGSTGSPLEVHYDRSSIQISFALLHRHRAWLDLGRWPRSVRLSGRQLLPSNSSKPPYWLSNPFERQLLVSTYHLRREAFNPIARRLERFSPTLIEGYPSAIQSLGQGLLRHGAPSTLQAIITTAETVTPDIRNDIETSFQAPVFDYYSASEGAPFIQQCERGGLHMRPESGIFEVLDPNGEPVPPGTAGELVVTSFRQWKTPLIRYRTGDSIILPDSNEACPCGRTLPLVRQILGRQEDFVLTPDGRAIGMFAYRTLKHVRGLDKAQIVQLDPTRFRVNAVLDGSQTNADVHSDLNGVFTRVLGFTPEIEIVVVARIHTGPSGKFRAVVRAFDGNRPPDPDSDAPRHG